MAQEHKEKIFERVPNVDFVVGPSDIHKISQTLKKILSTQPYEMKICCDQTGPFFFGGGGICLSCTGFPFPGLYLFERSCSSSSFKYAFSSLSLAFSFSSSRAKNNPLSSRG